MAERDAFGPRLVRAAEVGVATGTDRADVPLLLLDRPPVNALDLATVVRLADLVESLGGEAAVLTSEGRHFSAGHDRAEAGRIGEDGYLADFAAALARILEAPSPLVGVLQGQAVGTGWILAACCEVLVVTEDALVRLPEVSLGLLGGAGHLSRWVAGPWLRRAVLLGEGVPARVLVANGALEAADLASARSVAVDVAARLAVPDTGLMSAAREVLRGLSPDAARTHAEEMARTIGLRDPR